MIYVSEMRAGDTQPRHPLNNSQRAWCKMQSSIGVAELDAMADCIDVPRSRFCGSSLCGSRVGFYYVLNEKQRKAALSCGATAVKLWEFAKLCIVSDEQAKSDWEYLSDAANGKHGLGMLTEAKKVLLHWETKEEEARHLVTERVVCKEVQAPFRREQARHSLPFQPEYSQNPHILAWWTAEHDDLVARLITTKHWVWHHGVSDEIVDMTPKDRMEKWRETDPLCKTYAWYNILWNFAAARAEELGLTRNMRKPIRRTCALCKHDFAEDSVRFIFVKRLGIDQIDFCEPCLDNTIFASAGNSITKEQVLTYLRELTELLQHVPPQDYGEGEQDFLAMTTEERLAVFKLIKNKPPKGKVKEIFGSWLHALIEAGVLEDGTRRTSRGTQCLARDGHICFSIGEKTIDDFLYAHGILHDKEPKYPEGNYRADFKVGEVLIEYFGLAGDPNYDAKISIKQDICKKHKVKLIALYAADLVSVKNLETKILKPLKPLPL